MNLDLVQLNANITNNKEVINIISLIGKKMWLNITLIILVILPMISVMGNPASADFIPPSDSGEPYRGDHKRGGSR